MKERAAFGLGIAATAAVALAWRMPDLGRRPMHTDEAVQAEKTRLLVEEDSWVYDPEEFHGPTLPYLTAPALWIAAGGRLEDASKTTLRLVTALFGVGVVLLTLLVADGLGRPAALAAAVLAAISPAMVFYSRYFIHEMLLVFFTFGALASGWRYLRTRRAGWALGCGAFVGLTHATKATCAITFAAMAVGLAAAWAAARRLDGERPDVRAWLNWRHLAGAAGVALAVSFVLYSSFFSNMRGPLDSVLTYVTSTERAVAAEVHANPCYYYLKLFAWTRYGLYPAWSEGLILVLAGVGGVAAFVRRGELVRGASREAAGAGAAAGGGAPVEGPAASGVMARIVASLGAGDATNVHLVRFLAAYTLFMLVVYSAIPYKTPWCALSFLHGMVLLAGVGAATLVRVVPRAALWATACTLFSIIAGSAIPYRTSWWACSFLCGTILLAGAGGAVFVRAAPRAALRAAAVAVLALGGVHLAWQAHRASFRFAAARFNPYVYGHTSTDLENLVERVEEIARLSPEGRRMRVRVIAPESWPLPWYFRRYPNVDYWQELPRQLDAAVVIAASDAPPEVKARLASGYTASSYGLRPTVTLLLYVRNDLWEAFIRPRASAGPAGPAGAGERGAD